MRSRAFPIGLPAALICAAAALFRPHPAFAQTATTVGEVVVTAEKRPTILLATPMNVTVLDSATLTATNAYTAADFAKLVPGLTYIDQGPGNKRYALRGLQSPGEPEVALYYDDIPISGLPGASLDTGASQPDIRLWDVDRIEVLRGPQGTLYGNGSIGGAIRILSQRPDTSRLAASVEASGATTDGGDGSWGVSGMLNVPLIQNRLAMRLTAYHRDDGGWIDAVAAPGIALRQIVQSNLNWTHTSGGRASLSLEATPRWTITAIGYFQKLDTGATFETYPAFATSADRYVSKAYVRTPWRDESRMVDLVSTYDLGWSSATVAASYQRRTVDQNQDTTRFLLSQFHCNEFTWNQGCSGPQIVPAVAHTFQSVEAWSTEARLASRAGGRLEWTVGGFVQDSHTFRIGQVAITDSAGLVEFVPGTDVVRNRLFSRSNHDTFDQYAFFGEADWHLPAGFTLTGGLRWFNSHRTDQQVIEQQFFPGQPVGPQPFQTFSESATFKKFELSYSLGRSGLLYIQAAQGFRAGGPNFPGGFTLSAPPYKSDSVWDYEAGWKISLPDRGLYFDGDVFDLEWSNVQQLVPTALFNFIVNAGRARSRGFEMSATWSPVASLTFSTGITYNDARLVGSQPLASDPTQQLHAGDRFANTPDWTGNFSASYRHDFAQDLTGSLRLDLRAESDRVSLVAVNNPARFTIPGYTLVDAHLALENGRRWRLALDINNLLNQFVPLSGLALDSNLVKTITAARPRTVALTMTARY